MVNENVGKELSLNNGDCIKDAKRFYYLGDMLNCGGGVESASLMGVRCTWVKFKKLSGLLIHRKMSLKLKGKLYTACIAVL